MNYIKTFTFLGFLLMLIACNNEENTFTNATDSNVFYLNAKGNVWIQAQTRAVTDTDIDDVYLFVFDGTSDDAKYINHFKHLGLTPQANGKVKVTLSLPQYTADRYVYALANVEEVVTTASGGWVTESTTLGELKKSLLTPALATATDGAATVIKTMPVASPFISSAIRVESGKSHEFGKTEGIVEVTRITAKISMTNGSPANSNFRLEGLTLAQAPEKGFVFPGIWGTPSAPTVNKRNYGGYAESGNFTFEKPMIAPDEWMYLYECPAGSYNAATGAYDGVTLILYASYKGQSGYYRLVLTDPTNSKQPLSFLRNHHYEVVINSIEAYGHHSAEEAMLRPPANINYEIRITDELSHDIVSNGDYYLGLTNSEYIYYGDLPAYDLLVAEIVHNAKPTTPDGTATVVHTSGDPLRNLILSGNPMDKTHHDYDGNPNTTAIPVTVDLPEDFEEGKIHLRIGTLEKEITVRRRPGLDAHQNGVNNDFANREFVYAEIPPTSNNSNQDWARFSLSSTFDLNNGVTVLESHEGNIRIHYRSSNELLAPNRMEFFVSRRNEKGRIRVNLGFKTQ